MQCGAELIYEANCNDGREKYILNKNPPTLFNHWAKKMCQLAYPSGMLKWIYKEL